jgi:diacylglycerol kinase family enzyme
MSTKIFINQDSFGRNSMFKWNKVAAALPDLEPEVLAPHELTLKMREHIQTHNSLIVGGGDGTIHHTLNSVFQNDLDFHRIRLGIVGLGSSCSFLKSIPSAKKMNTIPYITDAKSESSVDLGKVFFKSEDGTQHTKYFAANGSLGFLALANQLFNEKNGITQRLKSLSTDAANNYIFLKSLFTYNSAHATVADTAEKKYLNIQFLKAKHYTGDYFFDRGNSLQSGQIDFHLFDDLGPLHTLKVFYNLTLSNEFKSPAHVEFKDKSITIKTDQTVPLELDGEIYHGKEFLIECVPKKLRLMTELEKA